MASYLQVLNGFDVEIIKESCLSFRKKSSPFPPSSGELFVECEKRAAMKRKAEDWAAIGAPVVDFSRYRLPTPKREYTLAQLADWELVINSDNRLPGEKYHMRVDEHGTPLKIPAGYPGAGQSVEYGYLTPAEIVARSGKNTTKNFREAAE